ncbi:vacuolar import/degradation [Striga asiatica]|uniref:Vacuolar import/degradation n=1 Tax=Striga asiatica TaxID=4170 RepID=A0A5A7PMS1_STRAF|nr:vacuolar import/degradation [Striga asiatica]
MDDFRLGKVEVVDVPLLGEGFGGGVGGGRGMVFCCRSAMGLLLEGFGLDLAARVCGGKRAEADFPNAGSKISQDGVSIDRSWVDSSVSVESKDESSASRLPTGTL